MSRERKPSLTRGGQHGRPHRLMAVWTAHHDNGWSTSVVENPNGSFAAWAAPEGQGGGVYAIQEEAEGGKAAAIASLRRATGHSTCSAGCSAWSLQTYAVFDRRQDVGRTAPASVRSTRRKQPAARRIA
jgi:hypothetical protein